MLWDNQEEMTGMANACEIINTEMSTILQGKDLIQVKKIDDSLKSFAQ